MPKRKQRYPPPIRETEKDRNNIPDYRRQDETPVTRTQNLAPATPCPSCGGSGEQVTFERHSQEFKPCAKCHGKGSI